MKHQNVSSKLQDEHLRRTPIYTHRKKKEFEKRREIVFFIITAFFFFSNVKFNSNNQPDANSTSEETLRRIDTKHGKTFSPTYHILIRFAILFGRKLIAEVYPLTDKEQNDNGDCFHLRSLP